MLKETKYQRKGLTTATAPAAVSYLDATPPEQEEKAAKESSVVDSSEPGDWTLSLDCGCDYYQDPPEPRERDQILTYLEVPLIIRTLSLRFLEPGVAVFIF